MYTVYLPTPHITRKNVLMNKEQYVVYSIPTFTSLLLGFPNYQMDRGIFIPSGHRVFRPDRPCPARLPVSRFCRWTGAFSSLPGTGFPVPAAPVPPDCLFPGSADGQGHFYPSRAPGFPSRQPLSRHTAGFPALQMDRGVFIPSGHRQCVLAVSPSSHPAGSGSLSAPSPTQDQQKPECLRGTRVRSTPHSAEGSARYGNLFAGHFPRSGRRSGGAPG